MPNKAHRAASRQAQVKRHKRRGKTRPQEFDAGPGESTVVATVAEPVVEDDVELKGVAQRASARAAQAPARRSSRAVAEAAPGQKFLAGELRQIGMIATMIVVVLAVLTVFLR